MTALTNLRPRRKAGPVDEARLRTVVLLGALASFLLSVFLFFVAGDETQGIFVGLWVPSILSLGSVLLAGDRR